MMSALDNVLIADFSHVFAGPFCTMTLADMGAQVIKIEPLSGDPTRGYMPPSFYGESPSFLAMNRNKQSIALDLTKYEGRTVALELALKADVLVENFSTGVMKKYGLDYESLKKNNQDLIYCSISGYGRTGPLSGRAGYDPVIQAETGMMSLNGSKEGTPYRSGIAIVDLAAGMFASQAILAALYSRQQTGKGQFIDVPLFDTGISLTSYHAMNYLLSGTHPGRQGNESTVIAPAGLFEAADAPFVLTVAGDRVWQKMIEALGKPGNLIVDAYSTNAGRLKAKCRLNIELQQLFSSDTRAHWLSALHQAGVPAGPVKSIQESMDASETMQRSMIEESMHETLGKVPSIRLPMSMSGTPLASRNAAPFLGQDTVQILASLLQYNTDEISELENMGVVVSSN